MFIILFIDPCVVSWNVFDDFWLFAFRMFIDLYASRAMVAAAKLSSA